MVDAETDEENVAAGRTASPVERPQGAARSHRAAASFPGDLDLPRIDLLRPGAQVQRAPFPGARCATVAAGRLHHAREVPMQIHQAQGSTWRTAALDRLWRGVATLRRPGTPRARRPPSRGLAKSG